MAKDNRNRDYYDDYIRKDKDEDEVDRGWIWLFWAVMIVIWALFILSFSSWLMR